MENKESKARYYDSLIWLLLTEYTDKGYSPTDYLLDSIKPKIDLSKKDLTLEVLDSTIYDFTLANAFSKYWEHFESVADRFSNALVIISYINQKYIVRDCYLANLAKLYTCWDTVYINCDVPDKITSPSFDYIVTPDELPNKLTRIIEHDGLL